MAGDEEFSKSPDGLLVGGLIDNNLTLRDIGGALKQPPLENSLLNGIDAGSLGEDANSDFESPVLFANRSSNLEDYAT
jgi:hypothetical protein